HFVTYVKGDYELVKHWYGAKGEYHECFMYPSNLYKEYNLNSKKANVINIQIGNSADPTNNHLEIFKKLLVYNQENIHIFAPLSYGNHNYAKEVIKIGKSYFGDKFTPITEFIPFDKYLDFLSNIDIAIFAHNRQQGFGNIITLLGLGKKVYLRSNVTLWHLFKEFGIKVFDISTVDLERLDEATSKENQRKIKYHFSVENLKKQLEGIFCYE
ncbi:MAG: TDP-N-acetylfucosamine:lipid II N-acetylfucosaminyltransferase, partial [Fervidobacterium sp.]